MKLITKAIERKLRKNHDSNATNKVAPLKLFDPYGRWTLYVFDIAEDGDTMFGFAVSPLGADCDEWGCSSLAEVSSVKSFGRPRIERDKYFDGVTSEAINNGARP